MTKTFPAAEHIAPPDDLATALRVHGLGATLAVVRLDGAPLSDTDRAKLPAVLEGYALARELQPTDDEQAQAAAAVAAGGAPAIPTLPGG